MGEDDLTDLAKFSPPPPPCVETEEDLAFLSDPVVPFVAAALAASCPVIGAPPLANRTIELGAKEVVEVGGEPGSISALDPLKLDLLEGVR